MWAARNPRFEREYRRSNVVELPRFPQDAPFVAFGGAILILYYL